MMSLAVERARLSLLVDSRLPVPVFCGLVAMYLHTAGFICSSRWGACEMGIFTRLADCILLTYLFSSAMQSSAGVDFI